MHEDHPQGGRRAEEDRGRGGSVCQQVSSALNERLYPVNPKMYRTPRPIRFILRGKYAQANGLCASKRHHLISSSDVMMPKAQWNKARTGGKRANSTGAREANSGSGAHTGTHFRTPQTGCAAEAAEKWLTSTPNVPAARFSSPASATEERKRARMLCFDNAPVLLFLPVLQTGRRPTVA